MNDLNHGIILETSIRTLMLEAFVTMTAAKTAAAMAVGLLTTLSVAALAENGQDQPATANPTANALVLDELATVDWIEKSDVAALREGVIEKMELRLGDPALVSKPIGYLHRKSAELTVAKSKIQAEAIGAIEKGKAAVEVAASRVARDKRLNDRKPGMVSAEDVAKDEGELKVADAQTKEAMENQAVAQAELALAQQVLKEHTIVAPFDGVVIKRMKNPGESVRANEAVVQLGKLSRLCANAYVPLKHAFKVREGQIVEIRPKVDSTDGSKEEIESLRFRGKITFVDPQIQAIAETARRIRAEFDNPDFKLLPGLKVQMTIYLTDDVASRIPQPAAR
jgi:RND family efflux transporter MFP subunit